MLREICSIAAQLAERRAEGMNHRIARVLRLQRQIEGLAEVLCQKAEAVRSLQRIRRIEILEDTVTRLLQLRTEFTPGAAQFCVVWTVSECHWPAPGFPT